MKFGKTLIAVIIIAMLVPVVLAVSMDTDVQGASMKGYGQSDSMSVEYHVADGTGVATLKLVNSPSASQVTVYIGTHAINNLKASQVLRVVLESQLDQGTYPVLVMENGKKIADCSLVVAMYYTVTVTSSDGGSASANYEEAPAGTTVALTATPSEGYVFDRWETSSGVTIVDNKFTMPAKNVTIKAIFKLDTYEVTVSDDGNGKASATPSSATMGAEVTLTATPSEGYVFDRWETSSGVTIVDNKFTMPAKNVTIKAIFKLDTYEVTVSDDGNGKASATPSSAKMGDVVTLKATANAGFVFKAWESSDVTIVNNKFTMPAKNVTVKAIFEAIPPTPTTYSITVLTDGHGTASASVSSAAKGTNVTLTADPYSGYVLKTWESSDVEITNNSFTMPAKNVTVKAIFEAAYVPVTGVTISDSELTLGIGDKATLTATVRPSNASEQGVTWSSDNSDVVSVEGGVITALKAGVATITVTTTEKGFTATCVVSVNPEEYVIPITGGQVTEDAIAEAIESVKGYKEQGLEQDVRISVYGDSVSMPAVSTKALLDLGTKVTIDLSKGSVTVTKDSIPGLQTEDDLRIIIEDAQAPSGVILPDDAVVVDVSMLLGETKVTSFDSPISISIPVPAGSDPSKLKVYYLSDSGKAKDMNATYDGEGAMVFTTDHLSVYALATSVTTPDEGGDSTPTQVYVAIAFIVLVVAILALAVVIKKR